MKKTATLIALAATAAAANAGLVNWQTAVGVGTTATATQFTTVSTPETINVGTTAATAMSFEFIVNASDAGVASALLGDRDGLNNDQSIRFEQYNDTGNYGITSFGLPDLNSGVALANGVDVHLLFTTDGTDSTLYVDGAFAFTFTGRAIDISGITGLGGDQRTSSFGDVLNGDILGFAAYDSELTAGEALIHANAFAAAVPEPSSTALLGLGGLALILRRRK